jgi:hypothetical protein
MAALEARVLMSASHAPMVVAPPPATEGAEIVASSPAAVDDGGQGAWLQNASPAVTVAGPAVVTAGKQATFSGTFCDAGQAGESYTYAWFIYGPGFDGYYSGGPATAGQAGDLVFTPTSSDPYTVSLEIYDSSGGYGYANATTENTAPTITLTQIGQTTQLQAGNVVTYDCTSADHDVQSMTFQWTASRFDQATQHYVVQETYTAGSTFQFTLAAAGNYIVTVTASDVSGASASASAALVAGEAAPAVYVTPAADEGAAASVEIVQDGTSAVIDWGVYDPAEWMLLNSPSGDSPATDAPAGDAASSFASADALQAWLALPPLSPAAQLDDLGIYTLELDLTA